MTDFAGGLVPVGYPVEDMDRGDPRRGRRTDGGRPGRRGRGAQPFSRQGLLAQPGSRPAGVLRGSRAPRRADVPHRRPRPPRSGRMPRAPRAQGPRPKIRGVRVEPAETERALLAVDGVREAAVVARPDRSGETRLIAFVVASSEPAPDSKSLRRELAAALPAPSIPTRFVALPALPVDGHGKLDRRALPDSEPRPHADRGRPCRRGTVSSGGSCDCGRPPSAERTWASATTSSSSEATR